MIWCNENLLWLCSKKDLTSRVFISKNTKIQSSSMIMNTYQGHMTWFNFKTLVICYLFEHWALSNCCDPSWDSRHAPKIKTHVHPQINYKLLHWELRKNMSFHPPNNYSIHLSWVSLSKVSYAKIKVWAMLKNYPCQKAWEKKIHAKEHEEKKKNEKIR